MNDQYDSLPEPDDDAMFEESLSHLKRIEPPLETRIGNRMAIAGELSSMLTTNRRRRLRWWRRSISVPVPVAASLLVVLGASMLQSVFLGRPEPSPVHMAARDHSLGHADAPRETMAIAASARDAHPVLEYRISETYVCGIGRLKSESGYFLKEQNR